MPATGTVTFVSTHANGHDPTPLGHGVWDLKAPVGAGSIATKSVTTVDLHQTVNIPIGFVGLVGPASSVDVVGAADCVPVPFVVVGTGAAQALSVKMINTSVASPAPTADNTIARLAIVSLGDFKHATDGTWA